MKNTSLVFFLFINGKYLSHVFYASPTNILSHDFFLFSYLFVISTCLIFIYHCKVLPLDVFSFFIFISDKYVSHFFYVSLKNTSPLFFLYLLAKNTCLVFFLCNEDKYLSRVYYIDQWEPCVSWFLYQWWIFVFCFFNIF